MEERRETLRWKEGRKEGGSVRWRERKERGREGNIRWRKNIVWKEEKLGGRKDLLVAGRVNLNTNFLLVVLLLLLFHVLMEAFHCVLFIQKLL